MTLEGLNEKRPRRRRLQHEKRPHIPAEVAADRARRAGLPPTIGSLVLGDPEPGRFSRGKH